MDPKSKEKRFKGKKTPRKEEFREKDPKRIKDKEKVYKLGPNDISWRTKDEVMTKLVANLPFGLAAGLTQDVTVDELASPAVVGKWNQAGIIALQTYLTLGESRDYNSAVNLASRKIYSFVRHANSGSRNYEAVDMAMYFGAMMQLIALSGYLQRALRTVKEYSPTNRYTPSLLVSAMGLNFDDLVANQPQLKYIIAWLGRVIKSLAIPDLPIFHAAYEAFQYIYVDNDSPKEQLYIITPTNIGIYDPVYDTNGGGVRLLTTDKLPAPNAVPAARLTVAQLFTFVKARTDVILGDEDVGIIAGDILKAFPNSTGLFSIQSFDLDYPLFQHSPEVLQQIHNVHCVPETTLISVAGYKQDPGTTGTAPYVLSDIGGLPSLAYATNVGQHTIIDAFSREPDFKEVVNCMVFNPQYSLKSYGGSPVTYGVDVDKFHYDMFLPTNIFIKDDLNINTGYTDVTNDFVRTGTNITTASVYAPVTNFDWHPMRWYVVGGTNQPLVFGDIQNLRIFDRDIGRRIHENSILNLLAFNDVNFYQR